MDAPHHRKTSHEAVVRARPFDVYRLIEDVTRWPQMFPPTVHAERLEHHGDDERIGIWATVNDEVKSWTSRRRLDPDRLCIKFVQETPHHPLAAMGGSWVVEPLDEHLSRVRLLHDYRLVEDTADHREWIERALDRNSDAELAALKDRAENQNSANDPLLTFCDTVEVPGSAEVAYAFLNEAQHWSRRLPHVTRVDLREYVPGVQILEMDTRTADGAAHTTRSIRVCKPNTLIAYKQTLLPAILTLHTGRWSLAETGTGLRVTSEHTAAVNPERIQEVLGAGTSLDKAKSFVRQVLSANSLATLEHAKAYVSA